MHRTKRSLIFIYTLSSANAFRTFGWQPPAIPRQRCAANSGIHRLVNPRRACATVSSNRPAQWRAEILRRFGRQQPRLTSRAAPSTTTWYGGRRTNRQGLPTYPFQRRRHWFVEAQVPAPSAVPTVQPEVVQAQSTKEETLLALWRRILGVEEIGLDDNFFELGGGSVMAAQLLTEIGRIYNIRSSSASCWRTDD
jgi:acyl transferase domain-containing protein